MFSPLLTKLRSDMLSSFVSFIECFIVGSKLVDLETPVLISLSSEIYGDSNVEQVIAVIVFF